MVEHEPQHDGNLKVSDRRHFTVDGERRPEVEPNDSEAPAPAPLPPPAGRAVPPPPPPAAAKTPPPAAAERLAAREIQFAGLIQELYATCMMQLGAELQPGQPGRLDLEGARETIDLLALLQQKTHGNLDLQEERLLTAVLTDLRMAYVEVQRAATSRVQPARVAPPPPRR